MISAKEARELSGPKCEEYLVYLEQKIKAAATKGERDVIIREKPYCDWMYKESDLKGEPIKVIKELRNLGYTARLFYQENQFVDMGLWIQW